RGQAHERHTVTQPVGLLHLEIEQIAEEGQRHRRAPRRNPDLGGVNHVPAAQHAKIAPCGSAPSIAGFRWFRSWSAVQDFTERREAFATLRWSRCSSCLIGCNHSVVWPPLIRGRNSGTSTTTHGVIAADALPALVHDTLPGLVLASRPLT